MKNLVFSALLGLAVLTSISACDTTPSASVSANELQNLTLADTQQGLKQGRFTLADVKDYYLSRIEQFDDNGPRLNAVVQFNPQLDSQLAALQSKIDAKQELGPLFGALVLLKDNIDTSDGMVNSAGSWLLRDHKPTSNAFLVDRLIAADAIIFGKTNLSEWANFRSTKSSSGWSSLWGQTRNPHDPTRSACGSSSGSGASIAADFALLAVGTETDGSVTCPAAVNGVVGIKPTLGLVSRSGIIPIAHSQDTAGPMTRSVTDAVLMLEAMMGVDSKDNAALPAIELKSHLKADGLQGKKIGLVKNMTGYHPELDALFMQQVEVLKSAGAEVTEVEMKTLRKWGDAEYQVLLAEFKQDLAAYFADSNAPLKTLQEAIDANNTNAETTMPIFAQEIFLMAQDAPALTEKAYLDALSKSKRLAGKEGIDALLQEHDLDLLIAPTTAPGWKIDHINGDHYLGSATSAAAVSGYPHITVPMGGIQGMPVGMSFFGAHLSEPTLVEAAYAFEQLTQARVSPKL